MFSPIASAAQQRGSLPHPSRGRVIASRARGSRIAAAVAVLLSAVAVLLSVAGCGAKRYPTPGTPEAPTTTTTQARAASPRSQDWLGLNYNSGSRVGDITDFSRFGIVYDRLGSFDVAAGTTVGASAQLAHGLHASIRAGMVPDVVIGPLRGPSGCSTNPNTSDLCLPQSAGDISAYVRGFIQTVLSFRHAEPRHRIVFEPMDEPWDWVAPPGTPSGFRAAQVYASILRGLLPAAKTAGIPLSLIYVPAVGMLGDGSYWVPDLYRAQPCLAPGPSTCGPVEGWNLHPYGPPRSNVSGIASVPVIRSRMLSGENNLIVSEVGFCASDVLGGAECEYNTSTVDGTSTQTARWLTEALQAAFVMHRAGWLRAFILWQRAGGGWSMQLPNGTLTPEGRALIRYAQARRPGG